MERNKRMEEYERLENIERALHKKEIIDSKNRVDVDLLGERKKLIMDTENETKKTAPTS